MRKAVSGRRVTARGACLLRCCLFSTQLSRRGDRDLQRLVTSLSEAQLAARERAADAAKDYTFTVKQMLTKPQEGARAQTAGGEL